MFDIGWTEMLVIAIVMIVVVGPKDLPKMLRTFGRTTTKLRAMAGDFRKQFDEALKEAELDDVKGIVDDVRKLNPTNEIRQALNPMQKAAADVRAGLDSALNPKKPATPAPAATAPAAVGTAAATPAVAADAPKPEPVATEPLARPELATPPSDFFPAAVDDKPSPVARAAEPLKNGATHVPAAPATKPAKAPAAKATTAPKAAAAAKPKPAPAAKAKLAASPKKPAARSKPA
jgi:sec-independent protein translocase protein TatB